MTNKEAGESNGGIAVLDLRTGTPVCPAFKNCLADSGTACIVGGISSFSGHTTLGSGDFVVAAQLNKPVINVWQWGKPQVHFQCHLQEITTALTCCAHSFILAGTRKGWIYCWCVSSGTLLASFQAHFKTVTRLVCSPCGNYCVSSSEDGMVRAWDMSSIVDLSLTSATTASSSSSSSLHSSAYSSSSIQPYRSYSPHTLSIKDMQLLGSASGSFRSLTCSLDRTAVIYDIHASTLLCRIPFPAGGGRAFA